MNRRDFIAPLGGVTAEAKPAQDKRKTIADAQKTHM
jgi:hypothetical protein